MKKLWKLLSKERRKERKMRLRHHLKKWHFYKHAVLHTMNAIARFRMAHKEGIDCFGTPPSVQEMRAANKQFIVRYLMSVPRVEIEKYQNAYIDVCLVFEQGAEDAKLGFEKGMEHGRMAVSAADTLNLPKGSVIEFACDFEAHDDDMWMIEAYFKGVKKACGTRLQVGIYGGLAVIDWAFRNKVVKWFWQTYAWSHHVWHPAAQKRQWLNDLSDAHLSIGGVPVDYDKSMRLDFGQLKPVSPH